MRYYSGFALKNEEELFDVILEKYEGNYSVAGFSKGAIDAFKYCLKSEDRIDTLILISPAFFNSKSRLFLKTQYKLFNKNPKQYVDNFLERATTLSLDKYKILPGISELEELLEYRWNIEDIKYLKSKGTKIIVFVGESDNIVDSNEVFEFFSKECISFFIKKRDHFLS